MALAGLKPEVWSAKLLDRLNDLLVFRNVCNTDYEGEIKEFGQSVKINEIGPVTVNTYYSTSTGALSVQFLTDAQKILRIDKAKYFAFWLDDIDMAQIKPKVLQEGIDQAGADVAAAIDTDLAQNIYKEAGLVIAGSRSGSTITGVDINSTNAFRYMSVAAYKMDENNAPQNGRWMIVPPWFAQALNYTFVLKNQGADANQARLESAKMPGQVYGFDIYVSNNVFGGTPAGNGACIVCGYRGTVSFANQVFVTETMRSPIYGGFKTLVRGLVGYGYKVVRPNTLGVMYADYKAEST